MILQSGWLRLSRVVKCIFNCNSIFLGLDPNRTGTYQSPLSSSGIVLEEPKQKATVGAKSWQCALLSFIPWVIRTRDKFQLPTTVNRTLKKHSRPRGDTESAAQYSTIRFKPYVSKVPWHTGPRSFLSQLFPRYGHYCGPNWSSEKDRGSLVWDKRPIDWLDFCCYCHDMGYDTYDQANLLKADLAFLECLEKPHMSTKGDPQIAHIYEFMCISGLRNILIPYRQNLLKLQSGKIFFPTGWLSKYEMESTNFCKNLVVFRLGLTLSAEVAIGCLLGNFHRNMRFANERKWAILID